MPPPYENGTVEYTFLVKSPQPCPQFAMKDFVNTIRDIILPWLYPTQQNIKLWNLANKNEIKVVVSLLYLLFLIKSTQKPLSAKKIPPSLSSTALLSFLRYSIKKDAAPLRERHRRIYLSHKSATTCPQLAFRIL